MNGIAAVFALKQIVKLIDNVKSGRFGEVTPTLIAREVDAIYKIAADALAATKGPHNPGGSA